MSLQGFDFAAFCERLAKREAVLERRAVAADEMRRLFSQAERLRDLASTCVSTELRDEHIADAEMLEEDAKYEHRVFMSIPWGPHHRSKK